MIGYHVVFVCHLGVGIKASKKAFTLVELLVVVAIVVILAAMALTVYQVHSTRARMAHLVPVLHNLLQSAMVSASSNGQAPVSLYNISGAGGGTAGTYQIPGLTTHLFYDNGSTWTNDGAMVRISIAGAIAQGIPGYIVSTNGTDGENNSIAIAFYMVDDSYVVYCGRWDDSSDLYVPTEFLPSGCNSDNFMDLVTGN